MSTESSFDSSSMPLKILCLHGGGETSITFRSQAGLVSLMNNLPDLEFVFADAPSNSVWMQDPPGGKGQPTTDPNWADESISYLDNLVSEQGPFFGILGYSQGAAFIPVYLAKTSNSFNIAIMFNGYLPTTHHGLIETIDSVAPIQTDSVLFVGDYDYYFRDLASDLANKFDSSQIVFSNESGHHLPLESDPAFTQIIDFISINVSAYSSLSQGNLMQAITVGYSDNGELREAFSDQSIIFVTSASNKTEVAMTDGRLVRLSQDLSFNHVEFDNQSYHDGININDVVLQLRDIVGLSTLSGTQKIAADINSNGVIEIDDVILTLRHIVKLDAIEQCVLVDSVDQIVTTLTSSTVADLTLLQLGDVDLSATFVTDIETTGSINITGTVSDDIIDLNSSDYTLAQQTILVDGGAGNDTIIGSDFDENILGGIGNDKLFGGSGTNTMTGDAGADEFQFDESSLQTTVSDFNLSEGDTLKFINQSDGSFIFDHNSIRFNTAKNGLLIDYTENGSPGTFDLSLGLKDVSLHAKGALMADTSNGSWFDRSLSVNGLELVIAGDTGGQIAVPDDWVYKVAQTVNLLIDPYADGIDLDAQNQMIKVLSGDVGTWHAGSPTGQRLANGDGNYYSPNPLENPESYQGYEAWLDETMQNDMVWYHDPTSGNISVDEQINEVLEHLMHTIHLFGVRGAVDGSYEALMGRDIEVESSEAYKNQELYLAMKEAMDNGVFNPDYRNAPDHVFLKEYTFLLNYNMWELGKVLWDDDNGDGLGSLAPEWSDTARTRDGILENNPLGHALFERYFDPVLSAPDVETLRTLFQPSTEGASNYSVGPEALPGSDEFLLSVQVEIM